MDSHSDRLVSIDEASTSDLDDVLLIERAAFGSDTEAGLVEALLDDPSARPQLSLVARDGGRPVGHILFTSVTLTGTHYGSPMAILAPLAVVPDAQRLGIGGALIEKGVEMLRHRGVDLVFVLGHPDYYPRHGFEPAGRHGLEPPFPVRLDDAWMVRALRPEVLDSCCGRIKCADVLSKPEYWS